MFSTKHNECVGFESRWKVVKVSQESAAETTEFATSNQQCTTRETRNCDTQTEPEEVKPAVEGADEAYMLKLSKWLKDMYPQVKRMMDDVSNGKAFDGYRLASEETALNCALLQTLTLPLPRESVDSILDSDARVEKNRVNLLTWNCTASILAAAITKDHTNWCRHLSTVYLYYASNKTGAQFLDSAPKKLNFSSCVAALRFHVHLPAILAVATHAGEVSVCNVAKASDCEVIVKIQAHRDAITHLMWINDLNNSPQPVAALITGGTDASLRLFSSNLTAATDSDRLKLRAIYKIKPPLFNKFQRPLRDVEQLKAIVCFDFSKLARDVFVVALEGGRLVQCSLLGPASLAGNAYDPVVRHFSTGPNLEFTQVRFSETRADIFASLGADGAVRLYVLDQEEAAQVLHPQQGLSAISWVPHVDKIVVGCGGRKKDSGGALRLFDVIEAEELDISSDAEAVKDDLIMLEVSSSAGGRVIATSDARGRLQIWQIPWQVFQ